MAREALFAFVDIPGHVLIAVLLVHLGLGVTGCEAREGPVGLGCGVALVALEPGVVASVDWELVVAKARGPPGCLGVAAEAVAAKVRGGVARLGVVGLVATHAVLGRAFVAVVDVALVACGRGVSPYQREEEGVVDVCGTPGVGGVTALAVA